MKTEESVTPRRGNWNRRTDWNCENPQIQSTGGTKGAKSKLDANLLDALWAEVMALNRAAGPWGALRLQRTK